MGVASLDSVILGEDVYWKDEWDWTPVPQSVRRALDGTLVIERLFQYTSGRPVTLFCSWVSYDTVKEVETLRDSETQNPMLLTLADGRTMHVLFRHHEGNPISVVPVLERPDYINQKNPDYYDLTIRLFEISDEIPVTTTT